MPIGRIVYPIRLPLRAQERTFGDQHHPRLRRAPTDWTDCGWHEADRHDHSVCRGGQHRQILVDRAARHLGRQALGALDALLAAGIGPDQAAVDRKAVAADETSSMQRRASTISNTCLTLNTTQRLVDWVRQTSSLSPAMATKNST
jgi:hypothetical protein